VLRRIHPGKGRAMRRGGGMYYWTENLYTRFYSAQFPCVTRDQFFSSFSLLIFREGKISSGFTHQASSYLSFKIVKKKNHRRKLSAETDGEIQAITNRRLLPRFSSLSGFDCGGGFNNTLRRISLYPKTHGQLKVCWSLLHLGSVQEILVLFILDNDLDE
jgi:hypothetical protein